MNAKTIKLMSEIKSDSTEPALKVGGIITALAGLFGLLNIVAPDMLSDNTEKAVFAGAGFLLPIITAIFTRGRVWSPSSVKDLLHEAINSMQQELDKEKSRNEALRSALESNTSIKGFPPTGAEGSN